MSELYKLVAEVWGDGELASRSGSGMLVRRRLVLTALHVVLDVDRTERVPDTVRARVRLIGDVQAFNEGREFDFRVGQLLDDIEASGGALRSLKLDARLVWPAPGEKVGRADVALLEIDDPPEDSCATHEPALDVLRLDASRAVDCEGVGFPRFKAITDGARRIRLPHGVRASIYPGALGATGAGFTRSREVQVNNETPDDPGDWAGVSGAALISERRSIVGVVHDTDLGVHGGRLLRLFPVARCLNDDRFAELTGLGLASAAAEESFRPEPHIVELDRVVEQMLFEDWLAEHESDEGARVIVVSGHAEDEIDLCVERFTRILREACPGVGNPYAELVTVGIRNARIPFEMRRKVMLREWVQQVSSERPPSRVDASERVIATALAAPERPRLVALQHLLAEWEPGCEELLASVFDLLEGLGAVDPPPVLFLCVQIGTKEVTEAAVERRDYPGKAAAVEAFLARQEAQRARLRWAHGWPSLTDCPIGDVEDWLRMIEDAHGVRVTDESLVDLQSRIRHYGEVPLAFARARLVQDLQYVRT